MYIGLPHINIIHILRIHIILKQRMQLITLIHLNQQQQQQRPQQLRQVNLSRLHLNNERILLPVISPHLTMPWEALAWIYEFRPLFLFVPMNLFIHIFSLINKPFLS